MTLAALLLTTSLAAQAIASPSADPPQPVQRFSRPAAPQAVIGDSAILPMTFTAGLPTLEIKINGQGPFKVGFDTGAPGGPHLTTRLAEALALEVVGEARASDPSGRNPVAIKLYRVDSETFGDVTVKGWTGSARPVRPGKLESLDAIVGLDAFAGYVVTLDYPHARFELHRGSLPPADGKTIFDYAGIIPEVPLTLEGRTITAHLDTGNVKEGLVVPEAFAQGLKNSASARSAGVATTVSNTFETFNLPLAEQPRIGATLLAATTVGYPSVISIANVGSLALTQSVVRVDPAHQRVEVVTPK